MSEGVMPAALMETLKGFVLTEKHKESEVFVEMGGNGESIDAKQFANVIINTVRCLENIERCTINDGLKTKWVLIEAAVIGDKAVFSLMGYEQAKKKRKGKIKVTDDKTSTATS